MRSKNKPAPTAAERRHIERVAAEDAARAAHHVPHGAVVIDVTPTTPATTAPAHRGAALELAR